MYNIPLIRRILNYEEKNTLIFIVFIMMFVFSGCDFNFTLCFISDGDEAIEVGEIISVNVRFGSNVKSYTYLSADFIAPACIDVDGSINIWMNESVIYCNDRGKKIMLLKILKLLKKFIVNVCYKKLIKFPVKMNLSHV